MQRPTSAYQPNPTDSDDLGGVALFFDVENILLGLQGDLDVGAVSRFLGERGEVMILRAYADWGRYRRQQRHFLDEGVQMVFLPTYGASDKNRTDTAICVDAMEILYTRPHIDTFCIVSGDSDFGVLAQRLRDHGKRVIGISARSAASPVLIKQCHEFAFYETLVGQRVAGFSVEEGEERVKRAIERVVEEVGHEFRAGLLKDRMRKQDPTFSERNYGASSFTRFLGNYDHLLTVGEGGMVRVSPRVEPPTPTPRGESREREKAIEVGRGVLLRTVIEATSRHGAAVSLSRLKDTMQAVAPEFDEMSLGFKSFTSFLLAYPDVVSVDRIANTASPADGLIPPEADTRDEAPSIGTERRKRGRKPRESLPTAQAADITPDHPDKRMESGLEVAPGSKSEKAAAVSPESKASEKVESKASEKVESKPKASAETDVSGKAPAADGAPFPPPAAREPRETRETREAREARAKAPGLPGLEP